jgi:tetratricopeptide (TPR) repeat protein
MLKISQDVQALVDQRLLVGQWFEAVKQADQAQMEALLAQGVVIDTQDKEGFTALRWAAFKGHSAIVQWLLEKKANPGIACKNGKTAVHFAAEQRQVETLELLVPWYQRHQQSLPHPVGPIHDALLVGIQLKRQARLVISVIDWSNCAIDDTVVSKLILQLQDCKTLQELKLANNRISHNGAEILAKFLQVTPSLNLLDISNNAIGGQMLRGVQYMFRSQYFSGAQFIFGVLADLHQLIDLRLVNCQLDTGDVKTLVAALAKNKNLKLLDITQNALISVAEREGLQACFATHPSLSKFSCEGSQQLSAREWFEKGKKLSNLEKYLEALFAFTQALALDTKDKDVWYGKSFILNKLGHHEEAALAYEEVKKLDPNYDEEWSNSKKVLRKEGIDELMASVRSITSDPPKLERDTRAPMNTETQEKQTWFNAAKEGDKPQLEALLAQGFVIDSQDKDGFTALRWAAFKGHHTLLQWLLENKANPDIACREGKMAVYWAAREGQCRLGSVEILVSWYQRLKQTLPEPIAPVHEVLLASIENKRQAKQEIIQINWSGCQVDDAVVGKLILQLQGCTTLQELNLARNHISHDGAKALANFLLATPSLTTLDLSDNVIGSRVLRWSGARYIFDAMARSSQMTALRVANCQLDKADAKTLVEALAKNKNLRSMDLSQNPTIPVALRDDLQKCFIAHETLGDFVCDRSNPLSASEWLEKCRKLSKSENYPKALAACQRAIELDDQDKEIWLWKGVVLSKLGEDLEALGACDQALRLDLQHEGTWNNKLCVLSNKARALKKLKRYEEAIEVYDEVLKCDPQDKDAWNNKIYTLNSYGIALVTLKHYEKAIIAFDEALKCDPQFKEAWTNKGVAWGRLRRYEEAIKAYDEVLKCDPQYKEAWTNKGVAWERLRRYEEAIKAYDEALKCDPQYKDAWNNKGVAWEGLGCYEEAIKAFDEALKCDHNFKLAQNNKVIAWNRKGVALARSGRYEEAIKAYDAALKCDPQYKDAWNSKGVAWERLGRYEEAIAAYDEALKHDPHYKDALNNKVIAWNRKGVALARSERYEEAIAAYDEALKCDPQDRDALNNKTYALNTQGIVFARSGRYEEAIAVSDEALKCDPQSKDALNNKTCALNSQGHALMNSGHYEEAIAAYNKALTLNPQYIDALNNKGNALISIERYEEAIIAYDEALMLDLPHKHKEIFVRLERHEEETVVYDKAFKCDNNFKLPQSNKAVAWNKKGNVLISVGRYEEAIAACNEALKCDSYKDAWNSKGIALANLERYEEAIEAYNEALKCDHNFKLAQSNKVIAWNSKGNSLINLIRYEEAIVAYDEALKCDPQDKDALNNKTYALNSQGIALARSARYEEAITAYNKALTLNPQGKDALNNKVVAWNKKGVTLERSGHYEEAIVAYDEALKCDPQFKEAWNNKVVAWNRKGVTLERSGRYEEAIAVYEEALTLDPQHKYAWNNKGTSLAKLERYEEAIAAYEEALKCDHNFKLAQNNKVIAWNRKGVALARSGCYEGAIEAYDAALKCDLQFKEAWNNKAAACEKLGRLEAAAAAYDKALKCDLKLAQNDEVIAWYRKGITLMGLNRYDAALVAFDQALACNPEFSEAQNGRKAVLQRLRSQTHELPVESAKTEISTPEETTPARDNLQSSSADIPSPSSVQESVIISAEVAIAVPAAQPLHSELPEKSAKAETNSPARITPLTSSHCNPQPSSPEDIQPPSVKESVIVPAEASAANINILPHAPKDITSPSTAVTPDTVGQAAGNAVKNAASGQGSSIRQIIQEGAAYFELPEELYQQGLLVAIYGGFYQELLYLLDPQPAEQVDLSSLPSAAPTLAFLGSQDVQRLIKSYEQELKVLNKENPNPSSANLGPYAPLLAVAQQSGQLSSMQGLIFKLSQQLPNELPIPSSGCDLYLMSNMPDQKDLVNYRNAYIFIKNLPQLFYTSNKDSFEVFKLKIDATAFKRIDTKSIKAGLKPLKEQVSDKILNKFWEIITSNESHTTSSWISATLQQAILSGTLFISSSSR